MKNILIFLSILSFTFGACNSKPKESDNQDGTHTHDDGSVHQNHESDSLSQEQFTIPNDTPLEQGDHEQPHTH